MPSTGRPSNESIAERNYLKYQCQLVEKDLNELEDICKNASSAAKEDFNGKIGFLVGSLQVRFVNIEARLGYFDDDEQA